MRVDPEHFTIVDGEVNGKNVQFTQAYSNGERTTWRAVVTDDACMVHGTWSGHVKGTFNARRSSRIVSSQVASSPQMEQYAATGSDPDVAKPGVAKLQLTVSSLEYQLRRIEEDMDALQAQCDRAQQELQLEVHYANIPVVCVICWSLGLIAGNGRTHAAALQSRGYSG